MSKSHKQCVITKYSKKCRKCQKARAQRVYFLKRKFGISFEVYETMLQTQNYVCKICDKPDSGRELSVDHCHKTGRIRGLLCRRCNMTLGVVNDDTRLLTNMVKYLS